MTTVPAGESPAKDAETERLITLEELEERLNRLEKLRELERLDATAPCPQPAAPSDRPTSPAGTTVIFSDEPCEACGERHG